MIAGLSSVHLALPKSRKAFYTCTTRTRWSTMSLSVLSTIIVSVWAAPLQPRQAPASRQ